MNGDGADEYRDVQTEVVAEAADFRANTAFIRARLADEQSTGIRVFDWPDKVFLSAGVDGDDQKAAIGQELSPDAARELATALETAADRVERNDRDDADTEDQPERSASIIKRLVDWGGADA